MKNKKTIHRIISSALALSILYSVSAPGITASAAVVNPAGTSISENAKSPVIENAVRQTDGWAKEAVYRVVVKDTTEITGISVTSPDGKTEAGTKNDDGTYSIIVRANGEHTITATNAGGEVSSIVIKEDKIDLTLPVINSPIRNSDAVVAEASYSFSVSDAEDGTLSVRVTIGDTKENLVPNENGIYSFTVKQNGPILIEATDHAGNRTELTIQEDKIEEPPTEDALIRSVPGWAAKVQYTVVIADKQFEIKNVLVQKDTDKAIEVKPDAEGHYVFDVTANGVYHVTITDQQDNTKTLSITEDKIDTNLPEIMNLTRDGDTWATTAKYSFGVKDELSGIKEVSVKIGNAAPEIITPVDGIYSFSIHENTEFTITAIDNADNHQIQIVNEQLIDNENPIISEPQRQDSGWATETAYTFSINDNHSGVQAAWVQYVNGTKEEIKPVDGVYTVLITDNISFDIIARDNIGNEATLRVDETQIDKIQPVIGEVTRSEDSWTTTATYSFSVKDELSGIKEVSVKIGNAAPEIITPVDGIYTFSIHENSEFMITAVDYANNTKTHTGVESLIDVIAPVISEPERQHTDWATNIGYSFRVSDSLSGVKEVILRQANGTEEVLNSNNEIYSFVLNENTSVEIIARDLVNNESVMKITESKIDKTQPVIDNLMRSEESWATTVLYTFTANDNESGIQTVSVKLGAAEEMPLTADNGIYRFEMTDNADFIITATDKMGNVKTLKGTENKIDRNAPVISDLTRESDTWIYNAGYSFNVTDTQSGVAKVTVSYNGGAPEEVVPTADGKYQYVTKMNGTYLITAIDTVGNQQTIEFEETLIDTTAPEILDVTRDSDVWSQKAIYTFNTTDSQSGVASVEILINGKNHDLTELGNGAYSFTVVDNGNYQIVVKDIVGNTKEFTVNEILIDQTAPIIADVVPQQEWDQTQNEIIMTVTDESELVSVSVTDAAGNHFDVAAIEGENGFRTIVDKNGVYTITAADRAGNISTVQCTVSHIDTEAPTKPQLYSSGNEIWVNTDVTVEARSEDSQSGVAAYWYSTDTDTFNADTWKKMTLNEKVGTLNLSEEQNQTYFIVAMDGVGRISEVSEIRVLIDKTVPTACYAEFHTNKDSGYNRIVNGRYIYNDIMGFFAKADDTASGIVAYEYRVNSASELSAWTRVTADQNGFDQIIEGLSDDVYTLSIKAYDKAGNFRKFTIENGVMPVQFIIENTPETDAQRCPVPTVSLTNESGNYNGEWTSQDVTIEVTGSTAISGIESYEFKVDYDDPSIKDIDWKAVPSSNGHFTFTINQNTNATYSFRAVTYAGNRGQVTSRVIRIQKSVPNAATVTYDIPTGTNGWYTALPNYQINLPAQNQYMAPVHYVINYAFNGEEKSIVYDMNNAPKITEDGIWKVGITAVDAAGNINNIAGSNVVFKVDRKVPFDISVTMDGVNILSSKDSGALQYDKVHTNDRTRENGFTIFKSSPVMINASANGSDSGIAAIYYQVVANHADYNKEENWKALPAGGFTLKADNKCRLFFKAVDIAGNVTYFTGESIIMDDTAPTGHDSNELTMIPTSDNLSKHGYYFGNVTVNVHVEDPAIGNDATLSGIKTITYRILSYGEETQSGTLFTYGSTGNTTAEADGRIKSWDGTIVIDAQKNNSNHIIVEVTAEDMSGNTKTSVIEDGKIRIDIDTPDVESYYDNNKITTTFGDDHCFTGSRTLTVTVTERNFSASESFVRVKDTDTGNVLDCSWESNGNTHTCIIPIKEDGHYQVSAIIVDTAGNKTSAMNFVSGSKAAEAFVIDNTAPKISVSYNNDHAKYGKYFKDTRIATITVNERNFNPENMDIVMSLQKPDETEMLISNNNWTHNGNLHELQLNCSYDGIYDFSVTGADALGIKAKATSYSGVATRSFIVDTHIDAPTIEDVKNGNGYADTIIPTVKAADINLDKVTYHLYRTNRNTVNEDITELISKTLKIDRSNVEETAVFDVFAKEKEFDGIYTLKITNSDKAGNTAESAITFSVNRFGSVYTYDSYLLEVLGNNQFEIKKDLIIKEYNPSGIVKGSPRISITLDGTPIANPIFSIVPVNEKSEEGWYEYQYVISKDNFTDDGVYEIVLSTKDAAGNLPENTADDIKIHFGVDTTPPSLASIVGLEKTIYKADSIDVEITVVDNVALHSIVVYLDGEVLKQWDLENYKEDLIFSVPSGYEHKIRIIAYDQAGNSIDTDSADFMPGYEFNNTVTVSTNAFLRYYANKPLFYGSIAVIVIAAGGLTFWILWKKQKKNKEKQPEEVK